MPVSSETLLPKSIQGVKILLFNNAEAEENITSELHSLQIEESLSNHTLHGILRLWDTQGLRETIPLIGQERIELSFEKGETEVNQTFYVTSVETVTDVNNVPIVHLYITSPAGYLNELNYLSKAYQGLLSETIEKIYKTRLGRPIDLVEDSYGSFSYIAPTLPPLQVINHLLENAHDSNFSPMFVFHNLIDDKINLRSFQSMYSDPAKVDYNNNPSAKFSSGVISSMGDQRNVNRIFKMGLESYFDIHRLLKGGSLVSHFDNFDITNKTYNRQIFNYNSINRDENYFNKSFKVEGQTVVDSQTGKHRIQRVNLMAFDGATYNLNGIDPYATNSMINQYNEMNLITMSAELNSNDKLGVGKSITFDADTIRAKVAGGPQVDNYTDATLSGKYLITDLTHNIKLDEYTVSCKMVKNRMG